MVLLAIAPTWFEREAPLHQIQRVGPRVEEAGLGLIEHHPDSSPYEDLKLKAR